MQIVINGRLLNYLELNPKGKTAMVILHGWRHNAAMWQNLAKKLNPDLHIYILDLPAFGSSQPLPGNPDVPEYTAVIADFITKLNLRQSIIVGHSFGGQVAMDLNLKHENLISKLILISPSGIRRRSLFTYVISNISHFLKPVRTVKFIQPLFIKLFPDSALSTKDQKRVLNNIVKYDLSPKLQSIKAPTLVIWGSEDKEIPYMGKFMTEAIPNARLAVLYSAGHNPHLTHTDKLAALINEYV